MYKSYQPMALNTFVFHHLKEREKHTVKVITVVECTVTSIVVPQVSIERK